MIKPPVKNAKALKPSGLYRRVLAAFTTVISALLVLIIILVVLQGYIIYKHQIILNNLLYEGRFAQDIPKLINSFYALVGSYSEEGFNTYQSVKESLESTIAKLDGAIVDDKSQVAYLGVRNIAESIIKDSDDGLQAGLKGDQVLAAQKYDSALKKNNYIGGDSVALVLAEMQYAETLLNQLNYFNNIAVYVSIALFIMIILGVVMFVRRFSLQLSRPLMDMAVSAGKIESGNFNISVDTETLARNDELGVLGKSFNNMATQLKTNIEEIRRSNANLEEAKDKLESKNGELEKLNSFMIDRELKMIELKKRIEELEGKK